MAAEARLAGNGCQLVVRVEGYSYPAEATGSDANWLNARVELTVGTTARFHGGCDISLRTDELADFRDQLQTLDSELTGEATLHHLELQVEATVELKAGNGTLNGFLNERSAAHTGAELRFKDVETDQSYVRQAVSEFDALVNAFPVRGEPYG
jgi:hypothetical protein